MLRAVFGCMFKQPAANLLFRMFASEQSREYADGMVAGRAAAHSRSFRSLVRVSAGGQYGLGSANWSSGISAVHQGAATVRLSSLASGATGIGSRLYIRRCCGAVK
jgi:hypothetical protein